MDNRLGHFLFMQNRILFIASVIVILALIIGGVYYVAVFLPKKQKASVDLVRSEMETKIQQEKIDREKVSQELQQMQTAKQQESDAAEAAQQTDAEQQKKLAIEASQRANTQAQQKAAASATLQKCLDAADADYKKKVAGVKDAGADFTTTAITLLALKNKKDDAIAKCKK